MCRFNSGVGILDSSFLRFCRESHASGTDPDFIFSSSSTGMSYSRNTGITGGSSESLFLLLFTLTASLPRSCTSSSPLISTVQFIFSSTRLNRMLTTLYNFMLSRPNVHFHCEVNFDPFSFMEREKKIYGSSSPAQFQFSLSPHASSVRAPSPCHLMLLFCAHEANLVLTPIRFGIFLGFTISLYEFEATIETLWSVVKGAFPYCCVLDLNG
jgi:hypothetical protein